jgi:hypothetical protein
MNIKTIAVSAIVAVALIAVIKRVPAINKYLGL